MSSLLLARELTLPKVYWKFLSQTLTKLLLNLTAYAVKVIVQCFEL